MDSNGGAEFNWDTTVSFFNAVYYYIFLDIPLKIGEDEVLKVNTEFPF